MRLLAVIFAAVLSWAVCNASDVPVAATLTLVKCDVVKHRLAEAGATATLEQALTQAEKLHSERNATLVARSSDLIRQDQQLNQRTTEITSTAAKPESPARDREVKRLNQLRRDLQVTRDKMALAQEAAQRELCDADKDVKARSAALAAKRAELVAFAARSPAPWQLRSLAPRAGGSPYPPSGEPFGPQQQQQVEALPHIAEHWPVCEGDTAEARRAAWRREWETHGPHACGYKTVEFFTKALALHTAHAQLCSQSPLPAGVRIDDRSGDCAVDLKWDDKAAVFAR